MSAIHMKTASLSIVGAISAAITAALGGWDKTLQMLFVLMLVDIVSGVACAAIWKKSPKTEGGAIESKALAKGLVRKGMFIFVIWVACELDGAIGLNGFARTATIYAFMGNEGISIVENLGIIGVPIPAVIKNSFELLKQKGDAIPPAKEGGHAG